MKPSFYVIAESSLGEIAEDIAASDIDELIKSTKESFACMNGCRDTLDSDVSWIDVKFIKVEDEDGNDITDEANALV